MLLKALPYWGSFLSLLVFIWYYPNLALPGGSLRRLGNTCHYFRKPFKKRTNWTLNEPETLEQKQAQKQELWHCIPRLTRCWAPKPKGLLVLSLWRLDKSTRAGHSRNMKGHEVSNPSRQTVEMSVRHSASTTFHRAKHLFMSEQIGRSSNLFFLPLTSMRWVQGTRARGRAGGSVRRQFSSVHMKAPWHATRLNTDIGNSYNLIREALAAATRAVQTSPLSNYTRRLLPSQATHSVLWK